MAVDASLRSLRPCSCMGDSSRAAGIGRGGMQDWEQHTAAAAQGCELSGSDRHPRLSGRLDSERCTDSLRRMKGYDSSEPHVQLLHSRSTAPQATAVSSKQSGVVSAVAADADRRMPSNPDHMNTHSHGIRRSRSPSSSRTQAELKRDSQWGCALTGSSWPGPAWSCSHWAGSALCRPAKGGWGQLATAGGERLSCPHGLGS